MISKINKSIGLLQKLLSLLPRSALIAKYETFIKPHLDYGDIVHDKTYKSSFYHKLELFQCYTSLAITGAIRDTSKERFTIGVLSALTLVPEAVFFCKIYKNSQPNCLSNIVPQRKFAVNTKSMDKVALFTITLNFLKKSFFLTVIEWNKLDPNFLNEIVFTFFKKVFCNS